MRALRAADMQIFSTLIRRTLRKAGRLEEERDWSYRVMSPVGRNQKDHLTDHRLRMRVVHRADYSR